MCVRALLWWLYCGPDTAVFNVEGARPEYDERCWRMFFYLSGIHPHIYLYIYKISSEAFLKPNQYSIASILTRFQVSFYFQVFKINMRSVCLVPPLVLLYTHQCCHSLSPVVCVRLNSHLPSARPALHWQALWLSTAAEAFVGNAKPLESLESVWHWISPLLQTRLKCTATTCPCRVSRYLFRGLAPQEAVTLFFILFWFLFIS